MIIEIKFKLINDENACEETLKASDYFDYKKNGDYKFNDVPKYNLIEDYINHDLSNVNFIKLFIKDKENYIINESNFWNNGKNSSTKYTEYNFEENYVFEFFKINNEIIFNEEKNNEILSFYRNKDNFLELRSHIIMDELGNIKDIIKKMNIEKNETLGKHKIL
ncbi:hypothetical protein [Flavobacterium branchiophilum]|uniref:Uncharacterized protein n=1 Tax=Flavobacterium branchiophilum TaxID=55197 RepID=A0A2H3K8K2_9FLAO|nr:hypothetical protein [Flavobacterium branchiophilum]PDS21963.1 hypothetical protein B0A77_14670 [Flavobacterium branchiophilum]